MKNLLLKKILSKEKLIDFLNNFLYFENMNKNYTAVLYKEHDMYVANCPELDVASQGKTIEEAKLNLKEAIELFLEHAPQEEKNRRYHSEVFVTTISA